MAVVHFAVLSSIGTNGDGSRLPQVCLDFPHVEGPCRRNWHYPNTGSNPWDQLPQLCGRIAP